MLGLRIGNTIFAETLIYTMKNLIWTGALIALLFTACSEAGDGAATTEKEKVEKVEKDEKVAGCNVSVAAEAAKCLCDLLDQAFDSLEMTDEEYDALETTIEEVQVGIDKAIEKGKYTREELHIEAEKLECGL